MSPGIANDPLGEIDEMSDKGYEIRGRVAVMDTPTNVANPFVEKPKWLFDHDIMTMMWIARCPTCKRCFPLGRSVEESDVLHMKFQGGEIGISCVGGGEYHIKINPGEEV